jgi:hypothetical protein
VFFGRHQIAPQYFHFCVPGNCLFALKISFALPRASSFCPLKPHFFPPIYPFLNFECLGHPSFALRFSLIHFHSWDKASHPRNLPKFHIWCNGRESTSSGCYSVTSIIYHRTTVAVKLRAHSKAPFGYSVLTQRHHFVTPCSSKSTIQLIQSIGKAPIQQATSTSVLFGLTEIKTPIQFHFERVNSVDRFQLQSAFLAAPRPKHRT